MRGLRGGKMREGDEGGGEVCLFAALLRRNFRCDQTWSKMRFRPKVPGYPGGGPAYQEETAPENFSFKTIPNAYM
eukprot:3524456-Rhodomonas_salina.2